ncbi:MAG TPA: hypothetical protein VEA69_21135 [Tepidisphaeraceae bacterium]|nr:hypothetical protein [Tepidisphaeraceae bacterium]
MGQTRFDQDVHVNGTLSAKALDIPASTIVDADVSSSADIGQGKLEHQHSKHYSQANAAASDETRMIHVVYGASGTLLDFRAGSIAKAVGDSTVTVDLKKNGTTVLSAVITLDSGNTNRVAEAGTLNVTSLTNGDVLEVVIDATIGTGTLPTGVFCELRLKEKAA